MLQYGNATFPVVGLGGSAGALAGFFAFFETIERETRAPGMAFVVVLHLPTDQEEELVELLVQRTSLPVRPLGATTRLEPDTIHVLPPGATLGVEGDALALRPRAEAIDHHPVDDLFTAMARLYGERAIALLFSGTGSNGSAGLAAVHEVGGAAMVQTPETAEFDEMPRRALATGLVDLTLDPGDMARRLVGTAGRLGRRDGAPPAESADAGATVPAPSGESGAGAVPAEARDAFARILASVRARSGLDLRAYKEGTLRRRIERRMTLLGHDDWAGYAAHLREAPDEVDVLTGDVLISVTGFFRDPVAWEAFEAHAAGSLVKARAKAGRLRVWVAGCATGEEAYTAGICLMEAMRTADHDLALEIFATDLSDRALARARTGIYPAASVQHLSPERRRRWFTYRDDTVEVARELREAIVFAPHNLVADPPFSRLDVIVCRNVLIYLRPETQRRLLRLFHFALAEDGCLFLGSAENALGSDGIFETVDQDARLYRRRGPTRHDLVDFPLIRPGPRMPEPPAKPAKPDRNEAPPWPVAEAALKAMAAHYVPPAALIDEDYALLYYHGAVERYFGARTGEPTRALLSLLREEVAFAVRSVVEAARHSGGLETTATEVDLDGYKHRLAIEAQPVPRPGRERAILVVFIERGDESRGWPGGDEAASPVSTSDRERRLGNENAMLRAQRDDGSATSARQAEELKAYNEEMTAMNEELRASNEELETSKEELQSLNEELSTVNAQLRSKVSELGERTADLDNLLRNSDVATLFLDAEGRLRWFSPRAAELFHVRQADLGRPLAHLVRLFEDASLEDDCRRVQRRLEPVEATVETGDERVLVRRVAPYRSVDDRLDGVVVTFADVTQIETARLFAERIVETVLTPFLVLDTEFRVRMANPAFHETFAVALEQTQGRLIYDLGDGQWNIPELRRLLNEVLPNDDRFDGYEVEHDFERVGRKVMLLDGRRLDHVQLILLAIEDVTERRRDERQRELLMRELAHRVKNALGVVQGLAHSSLRRSASLAEFETAFLGRLDAFSRSHGRLIEGGWEAQPLATVIAGSIEAHAIEPERLGYWGPDVEVGPDEALSLGLALHELETNAVKYGALSVDGGHVGISWSREADGVLRIVWREQGGPPAVAPEREGFGSRLVRQCIEHEAGGHVDFDFAPEGLTVTMRYRQRPPAAGNGGA